MVDLVETLGSWYPKKIRCQTTTNKIYYQVPIPDDFVTDPGYLGLTPNHSAAFLMPDGRTLKQNQPFHRCEKGGLAVTNNYDGFRVPFEDTDFFGLGATGAHGGSDMSSVGGTLRVGELVPGAPPIHHALKINLHHHNAAKFRWLTV